ncbi:MAG TPA: uroporphyrinogen-III C-methyltransferase [Clostridiaceae bacterium]|nr:uroporphyrinogen-III C-methyltransferase [Clostridiaceae bacterium]
MKKGKVYLIGAGPGYPGYLTLRGHQLLQRSDVVLYDHLIGKPILNLIPDSAEQIYVGKHGSKHRYKQKEINDMIVDLATEGKTVARLKGGDSFLFGRGAEEILAIEAEGIAFEVVPGIPSPTSVSLLGGIPLTCRNKSSSIHIYTGHFRAGGKLDFDYKAMVNTGGTMVFLMSLGNMREIAAGLMAAGLDPDTKAAAIMEGSQPGQRKVLAPLHQLCDAMEAANFVSPVLILVGAVCDYSEQLDWFTKRPLFGKRYLVTRVEDTPGRLTSLLEEEGAVVDHFATVEYNALSFVIPEKFDYLVFTSPRAVDTFMTAFLQDRDLRSLGGIKIAVLGDRTGARLEKYHLRPDYISSHPTGRALAENLAAACQGENPDLVLEKGKTMLLPRSAGGSTEINKILSPYYDLIDLHLYTVRPLEFAGDISGYDQLLFTSASAVRGFSKLNMQGKPALCIGEITAQAAKELGMDITVAREASLESMVETLVAQESIIKQK